MPENINPDLYLPDNGTPFSVNEIELLRFIEGMINTPDEKGKEWWEEYDRDFEKYRFKI